MTTTTDLSSANDDLVTSSFHNSTTDNIAITSPISPSSLRPSLADEAVVSFAEDRNAMHLYEDVRTLDEKWFNAIDLKERRKAEMRILKSTGIGLLLKSTFENPCADAQKHIQAYSQFYWCSSWNYAEGMKTTKNETKNTNTKNKATAREKVTVVATPRGLEKSLCREHEEDRSSVRQRYKQGFVLRQRLMKRTGTPESEMRNELASFSKNYSKCARRFARRQGLADAQHAVTVKQQQQFGIKNEQSFKANDDDDTAAIIMVQELIKKLRLKAERRFSMEDKRSHSSPSLQYESSILKGRGRGENNSTRKRSSVKLTTATTAVSSAEEEAMPSLKRCSSAPLPKYSSSSMLCQVPDAAASTFLMSGGVGSAANFTYNNINNGEDKPVTGIIAKISQSRRDTTTGSASNMIDGAPFLRLEQRPRKISRPILSSGRSKRRLLSSPSSSPAGSIRNLSDLSSPSTSPLSLSPAGSSRNFMGSSSSLSSSPLSLSPAGSLHQLDSSLPSLPSPVSLPSVGSLSQPVPGQHDDDENDNFNTDPKYTSAPIVNNSHHLDEERLIITTSAKPTLKTQEQEEEQQQKYEKTSSSTPSGKRARSRIRKRLSLQPTSTLEEVQPSSSELFKKIASEPSSFHRHVSSSTKSPSIDLEEPSSCMANATFDVSNSSSISRVTKKKNSTTTLSSSLFKKLFKSSSIMRSSKSTQQQRRRRASTSNSKATVAVGGHVEALILRKEGLPLI